MCLTLAKATAIIDHHTRQRPAGRAYTWTDIGFVDSLLTRADSTACPPNSIRSTPTPQRMEPFSTAQPEATAPTTSSDPWGWKWVPDPRVVLGSISGRNTRPYWTRRE